MLQVQSSLEVSEPRLSLISKSTSSRYEKSQSNWTCGLVLSNAPTTRGHMLCVFVSKFGLDSLGAEM
jgi:hypothetical protein